MAGFMPAIHVLPRCITLRRGRPRRARAWRMWGVAVRPGSPLSRGRADERPRAPNSAHSRASGNPEPSCWLVISF